MKEMLLRQNSRTFLTKFLLHRYYLLVTARELWWVIQKPLELKWGEHNRSIFVLLLSS
jgi:hypothetical protein